MNTDLCLIGPMNRPLEDLGGYSQETSRGQAPGGTGRLESGPGRPWEVQGGSCKALAGQIQAQLGPGRL